VQGLKNAEEILDVLKTAHEGDEVTKITKRETIEGELGQSICPQQRRRAKAMYNRLKQWSIKCATSGAQNGMTMKWSRLFLDSSFS
jgi:hypothetical protein